MNEARRLIGTCTDTKHRYLQMALFSTVATSSTGCKWDHGFDPTIDTSTGCKWDHSFDPKTDSSTGCKWDHGFDHKYRV